METEKNVDRVEILIGSILNCFSTLLQINDFETEKDVDFVEIFIGGKTEATAKHLATLSGVKSTPLIFRSFNRFMIVRFMADQTIGLKGFQATYTSCKCVLFDFV